MKKFALTLALALGVLMATGAGAGWAADPFDPTGTKTTKTGNGIDPFAPKKADTKPADKKSAQAVPQKDAVSIEQAKAVFTWMKEQEDIAFRYVADGCYARAHLMIQRMQAMGLNPGRAWAMQTTKAAIFVETPYGAHTINGRKAQAWTYHCAPTLKVRLADGSTMVCVIDPSLFDRPVALKTWQDAIRSSDGSRVHFTETKFGEAPQQADGSAGKGNGYSTNDVGNLDLDDYSVKKMKEYKAKEPKAVTTES